MLPPHPPSSSRHDGNPSFAQPAHVTYLPSDPAVVTNEKRVGHVVCFGSMTVAAGAWQARWRRRPRWATRAWAPCWALAPIKEHPERDQGGRFTIAAVNGASWYGK